MPTVFVGENLRDAPESYVTVDNFRGAYMGVEYLYGLGHRKILYFGKRKGSTTHQLRSEGYEAACRDLGIRPHYLNNTEKGIRIPDDLSLLGFDNIRDSGLPRIGLTTIEQPRKLLASMAVDSLLDKIGNELSGYTHRILTPRWWSAPPAGVISEG